MIQAFYKSSILVHKRRVYREVSKFYFGSKKEDSTEKLSSSILVHKRRFYGEVTNNES